MRGLVTVLGRKPTPFLSRMCSQSGWKKRKLQQHVIGTYIRTYTLTCTLPERISSYVQLPEEGYQGEAIETRITSRAYVYSCDETAFEVNFWMKALV